MIITAVFDKKLEAFMPQTVSAYENVLVASRNYKAVLRDSFMTENVDDFFIWRLCEIDSDTGEVLDTVKSLICSLSDLFGSESNSEK